MPQDPRYDLLNSTGTVVGTVYETSTGKIALHHAGSDTEITVGSDGPAFEGAELLRDGTPWYLVETEADLTPLENGDMGTFVVLGTLDTDATITLSEGQTLAGVGSSSRIRPTGDFPVVEIIPDGFTDQPHLTTLAIDIDGASISNYTSSAIQFTSEGRYEYGPPHVSDVIIHGAGSAGTGSVGIELYADSTLRASGVSWVRVDGVRIYDFDHAIEQNTADSSAWINANEFHNIDTMSSTVGLYQDLSSGMQQDNNIYHLATNGSSSTEKFVHIEGDNNVVYSDLYDPNLNTDPWGWGTLAGNFNEVVARVGGYWIGRRTENSGYGNTIRAPRWNEHEWLVAPGYPTWIEPDDTAGASYTRHGGESAVQLDSDGTSAGASTALEPAGGGADIYSRWAFPWFEGAFALDQTTDLFAALELYGGASDRYGIYADPTDTLGTGVTSNFVAYAESSPDGSQSADTGIGLDTEIHYATVTMGREAWGIGISLDGESHLRFEQSSDPPDGHPRVAIEQTGGTNRTMHVVDRLQYSQLTADLTG